MIYRDRGVTDALLDVAARGLPFRDQADDAVRRPGVDLGRVGAFQPTDITRELHRRQARYGLETMCIGGGQGIAMVLEQA